MRQGVMLSVSGAMVASAIQMSAWREYRCEYFSVKQ